MKNKITGLKLEEIAKFEAEKFSSCIVRYNGKVGGNVFEKEISLQEVLTLHKSLYTDLPYTENEREILKNSYLKELIIDGPGPYGNIVAKFSEYDLIRK